MVQPIRTRKLVAASGCRSVFVWDDGRPVSMAAWAGRTGCSRIAYDSLGRQRSTARSGERWLLFDRNAVDPLHPDLELQIEAHLAWVGRIQNEDELGEEVLVVAEAQL